MANVLLLEVPAVPAWPDEAAPGVLIPELAGGMLQASDVGGVLVLPGDPDGFLFGSTPSTFLLTLGEQGPPGSHAEQISQIVVGGAEPTPVSGLPILFLESAGTSDPDDFVPSVIV